MEGHRYGDERELACTMTSVLLRLVRRWGGEPAVSDLLRRADTHHDVAYLENPDNWVSLREAMGLLQAGIDITGDPRIPYRVGEDAVRQHAGTQVSTLLRSLGSPEAVLASITATAAKFSAVTEMEAVETGPGHAVVRAFARPGYTRSPLHCDWTAGLLSSPCMLFGLPPARVEEVECQARGGHECRFVVSWDKELAEAAADPEQRVTALEAQVVAMAERLESAYATASDLISPDDLDTVLDRIVERAANAVRAPGYLLAVRPRPTDELRVFSRGLSEAEADQVAQAAEEPGDDGTVLRVEVASSRTFYGHLVAIHPAGWRFFPQEQQLLALYAKHAAAVLDTATALQDASRRHQHVSALLSLSQALAQGGTTAEVAERLSRDVRNVIDCDRASVWVWDEPGQRLVLQGHSGVGEVPNAEIHRSQTPQLEQMLRDRDPMFLSAGSEDPGLEAIMTDARLVALAVVPLVAREAFLGSLSVGVADGPERLAPSLELREKLEGVAALGATALQNGRLIDELGRQVVQDGLTGVLNRTGFSRSVERVLGSLESGLEGRAGLLFVDLDHFKALNDEHGHQFGDCLLCAVAERLRRAFRGEDQVARLGGDEFAVILGRVREADDLHTAAARARRVFAEPFSIEGITVHLGASIGQALAPDHGSSIDELVRHADQAMYREKSLARSGR